MPGLALRRPVADLTGEGCRDEHIAAHHHAAREDDRKHPTCKEHPDQPHEHHECRRERKAQRPDPVDHAAKEDADRRGHDQNHAQNDGIALNFQIILDIDDKIGEEGLHRDGEYAERRKRQIERRMRPHDRGAESIDEVPKIRLFARLELRFLDEEAAHKARQRDEPAEDGEEFAPFAALRHAVERAEDDEHRDERQNCQHRFGLAAVGLGDGVGDVGVEGRVVRGRAEEGHHAVEYDDHHRRRGHGVRREELRRVFNCHKAECRRAHAPEQIAAADEQLPLAHAVGQRAHQQRGERRGCGAPADHRRNVARIGRDRVVEEDVEIHVFDRPCELAHQTDQNQGQPQARGELFHPKTSHFLSASSIAYCKPPRKGRGMVHVRPYRQSRKFSKKVPRRSDRQAGDLVYQVLSVSS